MKTLTLNAVTRCLCTAALFASLGASVQGQTLVDKTPVLHMSFDNVSGTTVINDGSGGSAMNGTLTGAGATIVGGGKFGNALSITGATASDSTVRIANAVVPFTYGNTWTLAMWIQTSTAGACYAYQGDGGWGPNNSDFYLNNGSGVGNFEGGVRYGTGWEEGTTAVNDGLWHHVVMVCNGNIKTLYLDGNADPFPGAANAYNGDGWTTAGAGGQFWIGGNGYSGDGSANLSGLIDEVYVFNVALTTNDITQLFSNNTVPVVPVAVTVSPTKGYRGQVVLVTATATPASGTVTNAKVNLSAFGLSSKTSLVLSSGNVFTNSFTVPNNAAVGFANVRATVIDTEPLIGSGGVTFTVVARPPTNASVNVQLTNTSVYAYDEASFYFGTTNDAPLDAPFPMNYAWYKNGQLVSTNGMGPYFTFLTTPADDGAQIYAIADVADTNFNSISITSAVVTLSVNASTPVYTNGLKQEVFSGVTARANLEIGNTGHGVVSLVTNADSAGGFGDNTSRRYSGFFIPPTSDNYVFFVASDDDSDVFVSTDTSIANKRLIAQEAGYSGQDIWDGVGGGNGSLASQKRSDQWTNGVGTAPYAAGIPLVAGQKYYFEIDMHNGGGGDNCSMTYETETEITADPSQPIDGSASRMTVTNNNIAVITWPGTNVTFVAQPHNTTVYEGGSTNFSAVAASDAGMAPYYQWFLVSGGNFPGTPLTGLVPNGTNVNLSTIPRTYTGDQIYCVATTEEGGISTTSSVVNLTVLAAVNETGFLKLERWNTITSIATLESGVGVGTPDYTQAIPAFAGSIDNPAGQNNFVRRISGYFIPPTTGGYKFYTTGDDDSDLFISTDNTPGHKQLVAHEAGWNTGARWAWDAVGGGGGIASQMHSDTWTNSSGVAPYASGIALVAGQKYYIEQDWHQGGGGANNAATFALIGDADPAVGTPTKFTGNVIAMSAVQSLNVTFTQQPTNATSQPQGYATFSAGGTTDSQTPIGSIFGYENSQGSNYLFFQWYKNGVAISGANSSSITLGPLQSSDSGASIYCQARSLGYADSSLNPIWTNSTAATLTISPQAVFETGVAKINWWTNASLGNVESGSAGSPSYSYTTPKFEGPTANTGQRGYATAMDGYFIPSINGNYIFFVNSDGASDLFVSTDSNPANKRVVAQETGWSNPFQWTATGGGGSVATQKRSDQFTPDGGATFPGNPGSIGGIPMVAGQKYYMQGVHQAGGGDDEIEVTYILAGDADPALGSDSMLTGNLIGIYVPRIPWVAFLQQPMNQTVLSGGNPVTFTALGTNPPSIWIGTTGNPLAWLTNPPTQSVQYQWYKNGVLIPGATGASYTQPTVPPSDQGAQFVCEMRALGYADDSLNRIYSNSLPAMLTVVTDTAPPTLTYASTFENTNQIPPLFVVDVTFNKAMNASTLSNATYTISGVTVTNVSVFTNGMTVQLLVSSAPTLPLVVTVNGTVKDLSGNLLASNSSTNINAETLTFSDIGTSPIDANSFGVAPTDPAYPSYVWVEGNGGYIISAEGSDIWNAADGCDFGWELKTNDFDVVVRGVSETPTSAFAKEGLMIRETLDAGSREWSIQNEPLADVGGANRIDTAMRATNGAASVNWQLGALPPPSYPNAWLRLQRTNSVLHGFYSTNGVNWVLATAYDTSASNTNSQGVLPATVYVGICTTAHANDYYTVFPPPPPTHYNTAEYANYNSSFVQVAAGAKLSVSVSGSNVIISWTPAGGHLESSPALAGPAVNWQTVGTSNPATVPIGSGAAFFRVVNP